MPIPKYGEDIVGVVRQWCGVTGKVDTCQVTVNCTLARPGERHNSDQLTWPLACACTSQKSGLERLTPNTTIAANESCSLSAEKTLTFPGDCKIEKNRGTAAG
jgi:hypothetical protein